jgi:hypothetical protein
MTSVIFHTANFKPINSSLQWEATAPETVLLINGIVGSDDGDYEVANSVMWHHIAL